MTALDSVTMRFIQLCLLCILPIGFFLTINQAFAQNPFAQMILINTHFYGISKSAEWLLIVRNLENGTVMPHLFTINDTDNFWVILPFARSYRITVSQLSFGPCEKITNYCGLENKEFTARSMRISLTGFLSPNSGKMQCQMTIHTFLPLFNIGESNGL